ncbi:MAG TPA: hypothetical protein VFH27_15905 [Longimicrobiaceae bacterium]|nr:hypothetical protein [Longimicrobiaceae bacterium]
MRVLSHRGPGESRLPSRWRNRLLPLAAASLVGMMIVSAAGGMRVVGNHWERHVDAPAALAAVGAVGAAEILLLYAILRPWSYHRDWRRALAAAAGFACWAGLSLLVSPSGGGVIAFHALWLLMVTTGLLVTASISFSAACRFAGPGPASPAVKSAR